jgi:phospholipase C
MAAVLPQITTVVHLMMENRSFDTLVGWLYAGKTPKHFWPLSNTKPYDGLVAGRFHNPAWSFGSVKQYPVVPVPNEYVAERIPAYDPAEAMRETTITGEVTWNGVMNQLFGNQNIIAAMPKDGTHANMLGFLQDYYADYMVDWKGLDILWAYTAPQLKYINNLAFLYAVSDHWFSSVPTQTNPNRAYSLCGTSLGREANSNWEAVEQFKTQTLFNVLAQAGKSWGLYYEDIWQNGQCFTQYTFPYLSQARSGEIATIDQFKQRAAQGTLPNFCYLEPKWGYGKGGAYHQGTDYHPPTLVAPGDRYLWDIFVACKTSPQWENLLFVVTFDEHGGTYDHVTPTWKAINPDGINGTRWGFDFTLFGARVPTLLISPYVASGTVFREPPNSTYPYDHTSFIKTMLLWAGVDPATAGLGKRVPAAPSFDGVLSSTVVNTSDATPLALDDGAGEPAPAPPTMPTRWVQVNELFGDLPHASVKAILNRADGNLDVIQAEVVRYRRDPAGFERELER